MTKAGGAGQNAGCGWASSARAGSAGRAVPAVSVRVLLGQGRAVVVGDDLLDDALCAQGGVVALHGSHIDRDGAQADLSGCLDAALTFAHDGLVLSLDAYRQDRIEHSVLLDGGQEVAVQARVKAHVVLDFDGGGVQVDQLGSGGGPLYGNLRLVVITLDHNVIGLPRSGCDRSMHDDQLGNHFRSKFSEPDGYDHVSVNCVAAQRIVSADNIYYVK